MPLGKGREAEGGEGREGRKKQKVEMVEKVERAWKRRPPIRHSPDGESSVLS